MTELRERFMDEAFSKGSGRPKGPIDVVVTAVRLPNGAIELITNSQSIDTKLEYLRDAYDDEFKLKANPEVEIVAFMIY